MFPNSRAILIVIALCITPVVQAQDWQTLKPVANAGAPEGTWSESDGVIEPAPRRSPAVIEPPAGTDPRMTTLPDVPPMVKEQTDGEPRRLSPADRAALKATLMSARAEALRGQEKDCFARLEKAKAIVLPAE